MTRALAALLFALVLMGQDCEPEPAPEPNAYCAGAVMRPEPGVVDKLLDDVSGAWNTIIGGTPSVDRRSTVKVLFGQSYCTGTVIGKRTVLTAGHCGYGSDTTHSILVGAQRIESARKLVHPDYWGWIDSAGGTFDDTFEVSGEFYDAATGDVFEGRRFVRGFEAADFEARKSDLMLLYTDQDLPGPIVDTFYDSKYSKLCTDLLAQGYGQVGEGDTPGLNESHYTVTDERDKVLITKQATPGGGCFGDSGSCLYAKLGDDPANLQCAGVLSTTASRDCLVSATYVKTAYFAPWIGVNTQ